MENPPMPDRPAALDPNATGPYRPEPPAPPPAERFSSGALLVGRYRVVSALGKGGMGEVYRADDLTKLWSPQRLAKPSAERPSSPALAA